MLASALQQCESAISKHMSPLEPPFKVFFFIMSIIYYFSVYSMWNNYLTYVEMWSLLSHVRLFCDPMDYRVQSSLSMGFARQECWSWLLFPSPGDLPDPGIKPVSLIGRQLHCHWTTGEATYVYMHVVPRGTWGLSSPTRNQTCVLLQCQCRVLTTGPPGKSAKVSFNLK